MHFERRHELCEDVTEAKVIIAGDITNLLCIIIYLDLHEKANRNKIIRDKVP